MKRFRFNAGTHQVVGILDSWKNTANCKTFVSAQKCQLFDQLLPGKCRREETKIVEDCQALKSF